MYICAFCPSNYPKMTLEKSSMVAHANSCDGNSNYVSAVESTLNI